MSVEDIKWGPWIDDMDRLISSLEGNITNLYDDPSDPKEIEQVQINLHSIKGLLDSVGLEICTQTIFELEENIHREGDFLDEDTVDILQKAHKRLIKLSGTIRKEKPEPEDIDEIDKSIGFESILIKFDTKYHLKIGFDVDKSLLSARALAVVNSIKRFAVIENCNPPIEDLYLDAKFDNLELVISSREELGVIEKKVSKLPGTSTVFIEKVEEDDEEKEDQYQDLPLKINLDQVRTIESGLATLTMHLEDLKSQVSTPEAINKFSSIDSTIERLQNDITTMRKVPLDSITTNFPSMVKRLAKNEGKLAEFNVQGRFITIDRSLANHIIDPITQILRNAISHGIEDPPERKKKNKDPMGQIKLKAIQERNKIKITIWDDGRGIDPDLIKEKAKKLGIEIDQDLSAEEIQEYIFSKGFSSQSEEGEISGRGLGLFAAKERISNIGGTLTVKSEIDEGTTFMIEFSDPDAISKNLIVRVNDENFAIPSSEIEHIMVKENFEIEVETSEMAYVSYEDKKLPVALLNNIIGEDNSWLPKSDNIILVTRAQNYLVGLLVDNIEDERLVNIRPLNPLLQDFKLFNGTISGQDQDVVLVINSNSLI